MASEKFLIHDLAERARTTIRTIRYYTNEGLLPEPVIQGKYAYYTPVHLDRLELIRRMKDTYLPLREIRQLIHSLTDEEVRQRLTENTYPDRKDQPGIHPAPPNSRPGSQAQDYISRLLDKQDRLQSEGPVYSSQPSPSLRKGISDSVISSSPDAPYFSSSENWQHIALASGVELHLREPIDADTASRIQQLIELAQNIFGKT